MVSLQLIKGLSNNITQPSLKSLSFNSDKRGAAEMKLTSASSISPVVSGLSLPLQTIKGCKGLTLEMETETKITAGLRVRSVKTTSQIRD